jgi:hypothetical protein
LLVDSIDAEKRIGQRNWFKQLLFKKRRYFMKSVLSFIIITIVFASTCGAATYYFKNNPAAADPNNWADLSNWLNNDNSTPATSLPTSTDSALIDEPNFVCNVNSSPVIKYVYIANNPVADYNLTGHFTIKNGGIFTANRSMVYPMAKDANTIVDIDKGGILYAGAGNWQECFNVGCVGKGVLNVKGTLAGLSPKINTLYISSGNADVNGNATPSSGVLNVSGNGTINNFLTVYLGLNAGYETGTLNILDSNSSVSCTNVQNGDGGQGILNVHNGLLTAKNIVSPWGLDAADGTQYAEGTITISGNGRVLLTDGAHLPDYGPDGGFSIYCLGNFVMCAVPSSGIGKYNSTLNIMDVNSVFDCNEAVIGEGGPATINMYAGTFNCNTLYLTYPEGWKTELGSCQTNLFGGTLNVKKNWLPGYNSARTDAGHNHSQVDIRNHGKLVLPYSQYTAISSDISLGIIKAYGGTGRLLIATNPGANTVTITACASVGPVRGDINNDCVVDFYDIQQLGLNWLAASGAADLNSDGRVNLKDFAMVASNWLYGKN